MTIDELKRALVEVKQICKEQEKCSNCVFSICVDRERGYSNCRLTPYLDDAAVPDEWEIDDWKEDSNEAR